MSKLHFWIAARPMIVCLFLAYCSNYQIWGFRRNFALVLIFSHKQTTMCPRQWKQLKYTMLKGKLHSKILSSDMIEFFSVESDGEGPRSKFEREDGQTDGGKTGTCEHL